MCQAESLLMVNCPKFPMVWEGRLHGTFGEQGNYNFCYLLFPFNRTLLKRATAVRLMTQSLENVTPKQSPRHKPYTPDILHRPQGAHHFFSNPLKIIHTRLVINMQQCFYFRCFKGTTLQGAGDPQKLNMFCHFDASMHPGNSPSVI